MSSFDLFPITVFNKGQSYKTFYYSVVQMGLNEADTLKSSSTLIYSHSEQSLYSQRDWHDAMLIKGEIRRRSD